MMSRPLWQRALFSDVPWTDRTLAAKVGIVVGLLLAFGFLQPYLFLPLVFIRYAWRYRKLSKAGQL
jgi:hypothetical protein